MTKEEKLIRGKLGLLELADYLKNVSQACRVMGYSRGTFYCVKDAYESGGVEALKDETRRRPNRKNRVSEEVETAVVTIAIAEPAWGQVRVSNELRKRGVFISPCGIRSIWLRHGLETMHKRLKALEEKVAAEGVILTENQLAALERKKQEKQAHGEIETEHPGYLGAQDTYYVGFIKGVGKIYQQTFVDTYSQLVCAKVYNQKTPITAADVVNDKVLPLFEKHDVSLLRILTDRGTEYCGREDSHDFELFLALNDIEHTKTKARSPQTNGGSASVSTALCRMSSTGWPSERNSTLPCKSYSLISISGLCDTTQSAQIREKTATDALRCRLFSKIAVRHTKKIYEN